VKLPDAARALIESGRLIHLVTINPDGSPQMSGVWAGLDGDEIVVAALTMRRKLANVRRDPRVSLSISAGRLTRLGLEQFLVVHGAGRVTEGGAPALLRRLARVYMGPDAVFPPGSGHPRGYVLRITPLKLGGVGPWATPIPLSRLGVNGVEDRSTDR
jgi:PPOX class probable F420-dependent enzyme